MRRPLGIFLIWLIALSALLGFLAAWYLSFRDGPALRGALAGLGAVTVGTAISFPVLYRALVADNMGFLKAYFRGMILRILLLIFIGAVLWWAGSWSMQHYLISVALSYPVLIIFEAWRMSRELPRRAGDMGRST